MHFERLGWGGEGADSCWGQTSGGLMSQEEEKTRINVLGLKAVTLVTHNDLLTKGEGGCLCPYSNGQHD